LFAGLALRRIGFEVSVHERVGTALSGRGAGIVTHPQLIGALERVGIASRVPIGILIEERCVFGLDGSHLATHRYPQVQTSWTTLFHILRAAFPPKDYHADSEFVGYDITAEALIARFADGTRRDCDLLIGADGLRSTVRAYCLPEARPDYVGYVAWRGLITEAAMPPDVHRDLFAYLAFALPPGEQILGYPVPGPNNDLEPGRRRYNFVWYRPVEKTRELPALLTDRNGELHDLSIPPPLIRPEVIENLKADAARTLPPQFASVVALTAQPFLQPIYDLASPRLALGQVALLGDAGFVARPHVGAGVTKAAMDALALAGALAATKDIADALMVYEARRIDENRRIIDQARRLGACITGAAYGATASYARDPVTIMAETASLDFLVRNSALRGRTPIGAHER
jgi:2-polyprenyl-6-methoxyphenol hydroxylase-like FAD-dependent oxidoreductase